MGIQPWCDTRWLFQPRMHHTISSPVIISHLDACCLVAVVYHRQQHRYMSHRRRQSATGRARRKASGRDEAPSAVQRAARRRFEPRRLRIWLPSLISYFLLRINLFVVENVFNLPLCRERPCALMCESVDRGLIIKRTDKHLQRSYMICVVSFMQTGLPHPSFRKLREILESRSH